MGIRFNEPQLALNDNAAGIALAKQWHTLATAFNGAAKTHQTVQLSGTLGAAQAGQSSLDPKAAPIPAWLTQTSGMVAGNSWDTAQSNAASKATATTPGQLPHSTDATLNISARAGLALVAGQDTLLTSQENIHLASGQDINQAAGGALRIHTGQAIGILGGAIKPGVDAAGTGLSLMAGAGDVDIQAQASTLQIAALNELKIQSQSAAINWAAAKKITLATAGGASITIEGGNLTFLCPGTITVKAGSKSFVGAKGVTANLPSLPRGDLVLGGDIPFSL